MKVGEVLVHWLGCDCGMFGSGESNTVRKIDLADTDSYK
jgi:hypothetical protein